MPIIQFPQGVWPVMLTPFRDDGCLDWGGVDALVDWYISTGVAGLFAVALSSEMYALTPEERLALAERVVCRAAGRVPVVASGTFGGTLTEQAEFVHRMYAADVNAVVVLACQLAGQNESEDVWLDNAARLLELTGEIPLGLYECPSPYHRLLSAKALAWAARSGRFYFHKDTCSQMQPIREKITAVRSTPFRFYNANTPTLLDSLRAGGDGFSGIGGNYYADLSVWLCRHYQHCPQEADRLQRFLSIGEHVVTHKYQAGAKRFLAMRGVPIGSYCRAGNPDFTEEDLLTLQHLYDYVKEWRQQLELGE